MKLSISLVLCLKALSTTTVSSVNKAINLIRNNGFDAVLVDVQVPDHENIFLSN
jgi:DNA-binding NtrC family response regulator